MAITIACIGSGNMGGALMRGAAKSKSANIIVTDADRPKAEALAKDAGGVSCASNAEAVGKADYVFLAVKPQVLQGVLAEIAPVMMERLKAKTPPVLVSMAAGWTIKKIQAVLGASLAPDEPDLPLLVMPAPVIRIMPNTPALIGKGVIVMASSDNVAAKKLDEVQKLLSEAGIVDRLEEKYLDAVTGLSGSGPAYVYLFIEALADGAVKAGLPRDKALRYAAATVEGAASMALETGKHPGELKDMVTSPGGTTIAGVAALENGAFRGTVMNAVEAAWRRSVELG